MNKDESIRFATKYLEDLLSFFGINVAVYSTIDDEVIQIHKNGATQVQDKRQKKETNVSFFTLL